MILLTTYKKKPEYIMGCIHFSKS